MQCLHIMHARLYLSVLGCKDAQVSIEVGVVPAEMLSAVVQVAGGSGITPMLQVASEIVNNPEDKTQVSLIFANQTEGDIILKDELDQMAAKHDNFQVSACCCAVLLPLQTTKLLQACQCRRAFLNVVMFAQSLV